MYARIISTDVFLDVCLKEFFFLLLVRQKMDHMWIQKTGFYFLFLFCSVLLFLPMDDLSLLRTAAYVHIFTDIGRPNVAVLRYLRNMDLLSQSIWDLK